jgi:hypothetical protein
MAGPALASVVRDYCPGLAGSAVSSVVPQPLDLADLGGHGARAQISGSRRSGTENALLGRPTSFAWVSRKVGGPGSGVVELRCVSRAGMTPALHLTGDQLRSTISAVGGGGGALSLARVAEFAVRSLPERSSVSFGFLRCDTHEVDLAAPKPGQRFVCNLQVYWRQGEGGYRLAFRVTPRNPYFTRIS